MNSVDIVAVLGRDPELRYTAAGKAVVSFSAAVTEKYKKDGQDHENTEWFNIVSWQNAEALAEVLKKGTKIVVTGGKMKTEEYEGRDGVKKKTTKIIVSFPQGEIGVVPRKTVAGAQQGAKKGPADPEFPPEKEEEDFPI